MSVEVVHAVVRHCTESTAAVGVVPPGPKLMPTSVSEERPEGGTLALAHVIAGASKLTATSLVPTMASTVTYTLEACSNTGRGRHWIDVSVTQLADTQMEVPIRPVADGFIAPKLMPISVRELPPETAILLLAKVTVGLSKVNVPTMQPAAPPSVNEMSLAAPPTRPPRMHRTPVLAYHEDDAHAVLPMAAVTVVDRMPKFVPASVTTRPPVSAAFFALAKVPLGASKLNLFARDVSDEPWRSTSCVDPGTPFRNDDIRQVIVVELVHDVVMQVVPDENNVVALASVPENASPEMVTIEPPLEAVFGGM